MIQIIGICLVSLVSLLWGCGNASAMKQRLGRLDDMEELIRYICGRIAYLAAPLDEICRDFRSERLEKSGFAGRMRTEGLLAAVEKDDCLSREDRELLGGFAERLGSGSREEEVQLCKYYLAELDAKVTKLRKSYPGKAKLWRLMPLLGSLSLLLLLW